MCFYSWESKASFHEEQLLGLCCSLETKVSPAQSNKLNLDIQDF